MKSTSVVTFFQICALYVLLLRCNPASTAPFIVGTVNATIKPYYAEYNKIILPHKYRDVHESLETLDEEEGNVLAMTSDTTPVIGIINDDNTAMNYGYSRSKQKDFRYDQFQSFLEALTSASSKIKAMSMTTVQPFGEELTTNSLNDSVTTEMLQTKHPSTANKTTMSPTPITMTPMPTIMTTTMPLQPNSTTTYYYPTTITTTPYHTSTLMPNTTTTQNPTTTTTQRPITTTTQRPKPNKFTCTLCVIIIVNQ